MSESSLIDRLVKERLEKNAAEVRQEALLDFLRARFGHVPRDITRVLKRITDPNALRTLTRLAGTCQDLECFRKQLP